MSRGLFSDSSDGDSAPARQCDPGWPQGHTASLCSLQSGVKFKVWGCLCALSASWAVEGADLLLQTPACAAHPPLLLWGGFASLWELWALGVIPGAVPMKHSTRRPKLTWCTCCVIQHQQRAVCYWVQPHILPHAGCSYPIRSLPSAVIHRLQQKPPYAMGALKAKSQFIHVVLQCWDKFMCCYFC